MNEFFTSDISRAEALRRVGSLTLVKPLVKAAIAVGTVAVMDQAFRSLPANPGRAEAAAPVEKFAYTGDQGRVDYNDGDGRWKIYNMQKHAPWPLSDGNWGPMTDQAARKWGISRYHDKGAVADRFDLAMSRMGKKTDLRGLLANNFSLVSRLALEQELPDSCNGSYGFCHAWAAASATMLDVLPSNEVAGVRFGRNELRHLLTLGFAHVYEQSADYREFLNGLPIVASVESCGDFPKFYAPMFGQVINRMLVSMGLIKFPAWESPNIPATQLSAVFTPVHPDAVGSNISPKSNINHGWSVASEAPMSTILKFVYQSNPKPADFS